MSDWGAFWIAAGFTLGCYCLALGVSAAAEHLAKAWQAQSAHRDNARAKP